MKPATTPCPCGNPAGYATCCALLIDGARPATSAEALMRSRYTAYVLRREDYLLATWHASTRPAALDLATQHPAPTWLGLTVHAASVQDADHASVEFTARYRVGGGRAQRMHEVSRFVRENGRWYYLDGVVD